MKPKINYPHCIEEFGGWNNIREKWWLLYSFPRKNIFKKFLKHLKKFCGYHHWTWKIGKCLSMQYSGTIYPKWRTIVCTEWNKRNGHIGINFNNQETFKKFLDHVKKFSFDNTVFQTYLKCL